MRKEELLDLVLDAQADIRAGRGGEYRKLEIKRAWWTFGVREQEEEFYKDLSMMANTSGGNGYILVGLDGETGTVHDSPVKGTKLDIGDVQNKARANIYPPVVWDAREVEVEGQTVTVLVLPPSRNRPHMVKSYRGREWCIMLNSGGTRVYANRLELDEMYADRGDQDTPDVFHTGKTIKAASWSAGSRVINSCNASLSIITARRASVIAGGSLSLMMSDGYTLGPMNLAQVGNKNVSLPFPLQSHNAVSENFFFEFPPSGVNWAKLRSYEGQMVTYEMDLTLPNLMPISMRGTTTFSAG